jgi:hypothetical protein
MLHSCIDSLRLVFLAVLSTPQGTPPSVQQPVLVTEATRANEKELARLQTPGEVLFHDEFESADSLGRYFEVRGKDDGRARIDDAEGVARAGRSALRCLSPASAGRSSGAGASCWFSSEGRECVHLRYYVKFASDYDQGNLNHTGGSLNGVAGTNKWEGMGGAGIRPKGDDGFSTRFEAWRDWGRVAPPGYLFCYTYWMDMKIDKDGHYWGNMLGPVEKERAVPERGKWSCHELMVKTNEPGTANGELAAWIDGRLYLHFTGIRWRSDAKVLLKRCSLDVYVHAAAKDNVVWYDDVVLSTGYVGPVK